MSDPGRIVEAKPVPEALTDTFQVEPSPSDLTGWLEIGKRVTPEERAALQRLFGLAVEVLDAE